MTAHLDHLVVVDPSLEAGARFVQRSLGFAPGPGRTHPHMGTHNLLLSLGSATYLEIVAIDPQAAAISRPRWFGLDGMGPDAAPRLAGWVANTDDIHAAASPELGEVETMEREGLTWQMTTTADGSLPFAGAAPLLIQRATGFHPASRLPDQGLRLRRLVVRHPQLQPVAQTVARIGLVDAQRLTLEQGPVCALRAEIDTPLGLRTLGEDGSTWP